MVDKICNFLVEKMKKEMPDIDDERAEIINYGLQIMIGEIPKFLIMMAISYLIGVFELSIIALIPVFAIENSLDFIKNYLIKKTNLYIIQ